MLEGNADPSPSDQELLELMLFAYQDISDARAVVALYGRMNLSSLPEGDRKKAPRLYKVSLVKSQSDEPMEREDDQLPLFK